MNAQVKQLRDIKRWFEQIQYHVQDIESYLGWISTDDEGIEWLHKNVKEAVNTLGYTNVMIYRSYRHQAEVNFYLSEEEEHADELEIEHDEHLDQIEAEVKRQLEELEP